MNFNVKEILTDESTICLVNGEKITGANDVYDVIIKCCEEYNKGYMTSIGIGLAKGFVAGAMITGVLFGVNVLIKNKKKTQK